MEAFGNCFFTESVTAAGTSFTVIFSSGLRELPVGRVHDIAGNLAVYGLCFVVLFAAVTP
jgi:hypothetical protein